MLASFCSRLKRRVQYGDQSIWALFSFTTKKKTIQLKCSNEDYIIEVATEKENIYF